jgi:hypothetical protein
VVNPQSAAYVGLIYYVSYFRTLMILMTMICNRLCGCLGHLIVIKVPFHYLLWAMCDDVQLCNYCVREFMILAHTWFAFGLPSKTGCDSDRESDRPLLHRELCYSFAGTQTICAWSADHPRWSTLIEPRSCLPGGTPSGRKALGVVLVLACHPKLT